MKKLISTYLLRLFAAALTVVSAAACTDDAGLPEVASQGTSVTLRIPNPAAASASRAADPDPAIDADANEGDIHSLWLLAYNSDGANHVITRLQSSGQLTHEYRDYKVEFKPGTYSMYVVANLDPYISKAISTSTTKSELDGLILNFSAEKLPNLSDGLPMACLPTEIDGNSDGTITINAGDSRTIQADLTFLCAKVRYTILFDNSDFSHEAFGDNSVTFNSASLSGIIASTALMTPAVTSATGAFVIDEAQLTEKDYPADVDNPGKLTDTSTPGKTGRAWQGTIYIPENLLTGNDRTTLSLGATLDDNGAELAYTIRLPKSDDKAADNTLLRGNFYDLIGRVTTIGERIDLTATVKDWTLQKLTYDLHGPYFLHVDKTTIADMVAGREQLLYYETDAPELKFESYQYQGKDLFTVTTVKDETTGNDYISVKVNPEIVATGETLKDDDYYFDIIAANLHKRIMVTPIHLTPFLNVTPTEIVVNIAEHIASGEYEGAFEVSFDTNLPEVKITGFEGWDNSIISLEGESTHNTASGKNTIKVSGMNDGKWTAETTFTLTYTATPASGDPITQKVTITVKPNLLDYVIHFRATDWSKPHVYVYQCLQFPADLQDKDGTPYSDRRSKPVGKDKDHAALEYAFTSKIAFKGWKGYGGPDINDPYGDGKYVGGFFIFSATENYDPGNSNRYHQNMDFNTKHRTQITKCDNCKQGNNDLYPGICMVDEGNGWWKYTLSGIASPGKALIMFGDGHTHKDGMNRFPGNNEVGIPLFDYPSREGWFDYANGATQFSSTKPADLPYRIYRVYFPISYKGVNLYYNNGNSTIFNSDNPSDFTLQGDYYYYEWSRIVDGNESSTYITIEGRGDNASYFDKVSYSLSQFTESPVGSGIYCYTRNGIGTGGYSGAPPTAPTYRILWYKDQRNACHIDGLYSGGDTRELNHGECTIDNSSYYYYDVTTSIDPIKIWLYKQSNPGLYDDEYAWTKNGQSNSTKFSKVEGESYDYITMIY